MTSKPLVFLPDIDPHGRRLCEEKGIDWNGTPLRQGMLRIPDDHRSWKEDMVGGWILS